VLSQNGEGGRRGERVASWQGVRDEKMAHPKMFCFVKWVEEEGEERGRRKG
jgi:hypothetical protein